MRILKIEPEHKPERADIPDCKFVNDVLQIREGL